MDKKVRVIIGFIVLIIIVGGGSLVYRSYWNYHVTEKEQQKFLKPTIKTTEIEKIDFSKLNKDSLLHKLFPNLSFQDGVADLASAGDTEYSDYPGLKLYLKNTIEDYFTNNQEKNLLLIVQLDGVGHAGGLYHSYLGLFDKNGNLLTPSSVFPKPNVINPHGDNYYDFLQDKIQFGADTGEFGFYDCKGVKYILFVSHRCSTGSCCNASAKLFRINNGNFENIQTIDRQSLTELEIDLKMTLSNNKILVKKVPPIFNNGCPETNYKELKWNINNCRFE